MYFKQIDEIISGAKTQTRRICKDGEWLRGGPFELDGKALVAPWSVYTGTIPHERLKWQVGRDYAVSPGRGKPGVWTDPEGNWFVPEAFETDKLYGPMVRDYHGIWWLKEECKPLRIRITAIRQERLQDISEEDAIAEGYPHRIPEEGITIMPPIFWYCELWTAINGRDSWKQNPQVWVLSFEVVK